MAGFFRGSLLQRTTRDEGRGLPKCGKCGFAKKCFSPRLPVSGSGTSGLILVGEAPGEEEDRQGSHFVGQGGDRLRDSLKEIGQRYKDCWHTYAMICKPTDKGFTDVNIESCRPSLLRTIDEKKPKVIVLLGAAPARSLLQAEREASVGSHDRWVGFSIPSAQHGAWLCPTFSMKEILKSNEDPAMLKLFHQHLRNAYKLVGKEPRAYTMAELTAKIERITSPLAMRKRMRDLAKHKSGILAFDYEATCLKPDGSDPRRKLISVSFCLDGEDTFAGLIDLSNVKTARALSLVLRQEKLLKVASNMKFEERWTRAKLGHGVAGWHWDTMLAAHTLDNRKGVTSVKFQAYRYFGLPDYDKFVDEYKRPKGETDFNTLEDMDSVDLLNYNGLDSLLEFMVMQKQRKEMGIIE